MRCRKCKMNIPNGAKVCGYCGTRQGISCGGLIGAFVFVIVALFIVNAAVNYGKGDSTTSSKPTTTKSSSTSVPTSSTKSDSSKPSTSSTKADTTAEPEERKKDILFEDVQCVTKNIDGMEQTTVSGYCVNNSGKSLDYFDLTVGFYDDNGTRLSTGMANTLDFAPGDKWFFTVIDLSPGITKYKIEDVSHINYKQ